MESLLAISFGELFLKGANRKYFFDNARKHILANIKNIGYEDTYVESAKLYIKADENKFDALVKEIEKVFGIAYIDEVYKVNKNIDDIFQAAKYTINKDYKDKNYTFKVETTRVDKSFEYDSPKLNAHLGDLLLDEFKNLSVDIHNPDIKVYVDIKNNAYIYTKRHKGLGGLPIGSSGEGLLLLSGGIDSPVAGFMMAKRGMMVNAVHFHSYPFTSKQAHQKAEDLARLMSQYTGPLKVFSINLANIYKEIATNCDRRETTILSRRFMMRISNKLADKYGFKAFITGESLGQVASQTLESISVIEDSANYPILRPLIGLDKQDIINTAIDIGTYDKSIEPYDDCCSIFAPDKPVTKPKLKYIERTEENLNIERLVDEALETIEIIEI